MWLPSIHWVVQTFPSDASESRAIVLFTLAGHHCSFFILVLSHISTNLMSCNWVIQLFGVLPVGGWGADHQLQSEYTLCGIPVRGGKVTTLGLHQLLSLFHTMRKGRKYKLIDLQCTDFNYEHLNWISINLSPSSLFNSHI